MKNLQSLRDIDEAINQRITLEQILNMVLRASLRFSNTNHGKILLLDGNELVIKATISNTDTNELGARIDVNQSVTGLAVTKKEVIVVPDVSTSPIYQHVVSRQNSTKSEIAVPMIYENQVIGVISIESPNLNAFSNDEIKILTVLAEQSSVAIFNKLSQKLNAFLCHASDDKPRVRELYDRLISSNVKPWFDEKNLLPGDDWQLVIPQAVRFADVIIICLSRKAITKTGYVQKEIKYALDAADEQPEGAIFVIPVRFEECKVPERLLRWQWVDLFKEDGYARLIRALEKRSQHLGLDALVT